MFVGIGVLVDVGTGIVVGVCVGVSVGMIRIAGVTGRGLTAGDGPNTPVPPVTIPQIIPPPIMPATAAPTSFFNRLSPPLIRQHFTHPILSEAFSVSPFFGPSKITFFKSGGLHETLDTSHQCGPDRE